MNRILAFSKTNIMFVRYIKVNFIDLLSVYLVLPCLGSPSSSKPGPFSGNAEALKTSH